MKKYRSKPKEPIVLEAIQVLEENKAEIEQGFNDVLLRFFYHDEHKIISYYGHHKDETYNKIGCWLFMHDAHCAVHEGDYIIRLKDGRATAREREIFEKEFEIINE